MHRTETSNVLVIGTGAAGWRAAIAATQAGVAGAHARASARRSTPTPCSPPAASTRRSGRATRRTPGSSTSPTPCARATSSAIRGWSRSWRASRRPPCSSSPTGAASSRAPKTAELDQRFFGAHRWRRTCYAGDFTGRAILRTVARKGAELGIRVEEDQYVSRLLVADGTCFGALAFDLHTGERTVHLADAVILATGGHTRIWRRSSSRRDENYGDGMRLALDAGCRLMDMELVQFHPTGMVFPEEAAGTLVTEAVRGEGGRLYNALGERFMERYDPDRLELSSRDRVALANYTEIVEGRGGPHGGVFLDISHRGKDYIIEKLPRMYRQFIEWQMLDISREPMEVAPTAHYTMGGIVVDPETHATDVRGLYAAGECVGGCTARTGSAATRSARR